MMKFAGFRDSHGMLLSKEASEACLHIVCVFLLWLLWAHLWTYGSRWLGVLCGRKHSSVICLLTNFEIFRKFADDHCCRLLSCRNSCLVKFWTLLSCIQCHKHRFRVCFYTKNFSSWKDTLFLKFFANMARLFYSFANPSFFPLVSPFFCGVVPIGFVSLAASCLNLPNTSGLVAETPHS